MGDYLDINSLHFRNRYLHYFFRDIYYNKLMKKTLGFSQKSYAYENRVLPDVKESNSIIFDFIQSGKPFSLVRPGNGEYSFALEWEERKIFGRRLYKRKSDNWDIHMSLFSGQEDRYNYMFRQDIADADVFVGFPESIMEEYLCERYCSDSIWLSMDCFGPVSAHNPWTNALEGKKVLFVSQFADYLQMQYEKRDLLYYGKWQFPEFELIPVRSVWYFPQQKDERFNSWFEALDYLFNEIMKHDFDIAILSCGSFAINLASMIKRAGKQAIQYAGELQMLFGIRGARWDNNPFFSQYFNESWIRIDKKDVGIKQDELTTLDNGCYW